MDGTIPGMILGMDGMLHTIVTATIAGTIGDGTGITVPVGGGIIIPITDTDGAIPDIIITVIMVVFMHVVHQILHIGMAVSAQEHIQAGLILHLLVKVM